MQKIKTALAFTKKLATTGALYETSPKVEREISRYVRPDVPQVIVEFGAGHGNITRAILTKMHPESTLYAFELHADFCEVLTQIGDKRLHVINRSAEHLDQYVPGKIDCIVSSIPFSLIPDEVLRTILTKSHAQLADTGIMSQVLYSAYHVKKYKRHFPHVTYKAFWGLPPEFVYHARKV